jgi:Flp pilus assembly protein TadB
MTVRVPADKFSESLDEIRKAAGRVLVETIKGQDVTEEFIDIEARLKAKRALEDQFMEIMKRSNTVADALNVQRQLAEVRGEIEKIEGRKRFLENQASLSTIRLRIQTPTAISASGSGFFYRLTESVGMGFDAALTFVLGLVTVLIAIIPFVLLILLPLYLLVRYLWRKARRRRSATQILKEEIESE